MHAISHIKMELNALFTVSYAFMASRILSLFLFWAQITIFNAAV